MGGGPKPTNPDANLINCEDYSFELKDDRIVSGLVHIIVNHRKRPFDDTTDEIFYQFVDNTTKNYQVSTSGGSGHYLEIDADGDTYRLWFKANASTVSPGAGASDFLIEMDISAFYGVAGSAKDVCAYVHTVVTALANIKTDYHISKGDVPSLTGFTDNKSHSQVGSYYLAKNDNHLHLRSVDLTESENGIPINTSAAKMDYSQGGGVYQHTDYTTKETDFKQQLFSYAGGNAVSKSPFGSNEMAPKEGELYDDGKFTALGATAHTVLGRQQTQDVQGNGVTPVNAGLGDHCTFLYYITAATNISSTARTWGERIENETSAGNEFPNDSGEWVGDFDISTDINHWYKYTAVTSGTDTDLNYLNNSSVLAKDVVPHPYNTGSMEILKEDDSSPVTAVFGDIGVRSFGQTLIEDTEYQISWDVEVDPYNFGTGLKLSLHISDSSNPLSGTIYFSATGSGDGGAGIAEQGFATFDTPVTGTGTASVTIHFAMNGTMNAAERSWINSVKIVKAGDAILFSDIINEAYNTPLSHTWYTEEPDDGRTYMWIRSHLLSVQNNSEPYYDNYEIKSHRVKFVPGNGSSEAGEIQIGSNAVSPLGSDNVDNRNIYTWKDWKPGDIIEISGAVETDNNVRMQINWDWEYNTEDYYGESVSPAMELKCMPFTINDDGSHTTFVFTETFLYAQIYTQDITITSGGTGYPTTRQWFPLEFTSSPSAGSAELVGRAYINGSGVCDEVKMINPGVEPWLTSTQISSMTLSIQTANSTTEDIESFTRFTDTDFTIVKTDGDHELITGDYIEIDADDTFGIWDGFYSVDVLSSDEFLIEVTTPVSQPSFTSAEYTPQGSGSPSAAATFSISSTQTVGPMVTIKNLTRRYQDSCNAKPYDYSIPPTDVDNPPPSGTDTHGVPYIGRYGNQGRVSPLNHMYDSYPDDFDGSHTEPNTDLHFKDLHEYEGRNATHHKLETFHNPVGGAPEIYGYRKFSVVGKNPYDKYVTDSEGDWIVNTDYIEMFSNGKYGETEGQGHKDYPSPAYGKIYDALGATFGKPEMRIRVPIKAFTNTTKVAAQDTTFLDPLYDTNIQVQWQPFGETKDIKLEESTDILQNTIDDEVS